MVEQQLGAPSASLFKFCYIIRGLPGTGKSTVAKQLAGTTGVVLNLDSHVVKSSSEGDANGKGAHEADSLLEIHRKHYEEFCAEVSKGTPIIVVDNNNIKESEYLHFI